MAKTLTKVSKASLAAILATSAIVPVASANQETTREVKEVIFTFEGKLVKLTLDAYIDALINGTINSTQEVEYVLDSKGNIFDVDTYIDGLLGSNFDEGEALVTLATEEKQADVDPSTIAEGKIEDGKIIGDTPEENLNETFFYNLAA